MNGGIGEDNNVEDDNTNEDNHDESVMIVVDTLSEVIETESKPKIIILLEVEQHLREV